MKPEKEEAKEEKKAKPEAKPEPKAEKPAPKETKPEPTRKIETKSRDVFSGGRTEKTVYTHNRKSGQR